MSASITAVILAAGKGTRMRSSLAKVLHEVLFRPMLHHVLDAVFEAGIQRPAVVIGHQRDRVLAALDGYRITPVVQEEQLGTGHAVLCARQACADADQVLILCGDTPLLRGKSLETMIHHHHRQKALVTLMTTVVDDPFGYGRILTDDQGAILAIREEKDASHEERRIKEINGGIYLVQRDFLFSALQRVGTDNSQGEVYLTDIVALARQEGHAVHGYAHDQAMDVLGVNSRAELALAQAELQRRRNRQLMEQGVTLYGPESILVSQDSVIGPDTIIEAGVRISGTSRVGREVRLQTGAVLHGCRIGDGAVIGAHCVLTDCVIEPGQILPPLTLKNERP